MTTHKGTVEVHRGLCKGGCVKGCYCLYTPAECSCVQCQSEDEVSMAEWLDNPTHQQIHNEVRVALAAGTIQVQGADHEDA